MSVSVFVSMDAKPALDLFADKVRELPRVLDYAGKEIARGLRYDYLQTTRSWSRRPQFEQIVDVRPGQGLDVLVGTDDRIYTMLDRGTRPHFIFPKAAGGRLVFRWDGPGSYGAKTTPGSLRSGPARYPQTKVVRRWVEHPGTAPRGWSVLITRDWERRGPEILRRYIDRWATT